MSCKVMYTCDHCGKEVSPYINRQWKAGFLTVGSNIDDIHACSKEHLSLALAKVFDIPLDTSTLRLVTEKNDALNAARVAIVDRDNMRARVAELEPRIPANEVTNAERAQYDQTIELQQKRIEGFETSQAVLLERLARIEGPAQRLVDLDNELAEKRDVAAKALFHDSVMRPIEELRGYFGSVKRAEKRGQTIFDFEVERRQRAEKRIVELEKRIAELSTPPTVDGNASDHLDKPVSGSLDLLAYKLVPTFEAAYHAGPNDQVASVRAGLRAVLAALPMPAAQPLTVDGKTPGQVDYEAYSAARLGPDDHGSRWDHLDERTKQWNEAGAKAVLRAFSTQAGQTPSTSTVEALQDVRACVQRNAHDHEEVLAFIDDKLAKIKGIERDTNGSANPHDGCLDCNGTGWSGGNVRNGACDIPLKAKQ